MLEIASTHLQDLTLGLVKPHEVHMDPLPQIVQVPLDGIPSLRCVNCTTQFGVICKLAGGALDPVYIIDINTSYYSAITREEFDANEAFCTFMRR